jgi:hypothetical protein
MTNTYILVIGILYASAYDTTPLNSFIDGLIPLVTGMKSVGEIIIDGLTDGTRLSV